MNRRHFLATMTGGLAGVATSKVYTLTEFFRPKIKATFHEAGLSVAWEGTLQENEDGVFIFEPIRPISVTPVGKSPKESNP